MFVGLIYHYITLLTLVALKKKVKVKLSNNLLWKNWYCWYLSVVSMCISVSSREPDDRSSIFLLMKYWPDVYIMCISVSLKHWMIKNEVLAWCLHCLYFCFFRSTGRLWLKKMRLQSWSGLDVSVRLNLLFATFEMSRYCCIEN